MDNATRRPLYWWVNHKQTVKQEVRGGYLWSPKREASGARSQFYDNMRLASPGDLVLSFADGAIGYVGIVSDFAIAAPKPSSFGTVGQYWSADGWQLPIVWMRLVSPVRAKGHIAQLAPLLPAKYSPINPLSGNGNQKAYLAAVSEAVFDFVISLSGSASFPLHKSTDSQFDLQTYFDNRIEQAIALDQTLFATQREQLIQARYGQGLFRSRVREREATCRITHLKNPSLLIASHIKPWRLCETATERLDGDNGLFLAPHIDRLFDRGYIGFSDQGNVLVSGRLPSSDIRQLGLSDVISRNCGSFSVGQKRYLNFHRENILLP